MLRFNRSQKVIGLAAASAALVAPAAASAAGTLERTASNYIFFQAGNGEHNDLKVASDATDVVFEDYAGINQIGGCVQVDPYRAKCPKAGLDTIYIFVQDGDNKVTAFTHYPTHVDGQGADSNNFHIGNSENHTLIGGDGPDILTGGDATDTLYGGGGEDQLLGDEGKDDLQGGAGNDRLVPGPEADVVSGGADTDTVSYESRNANLQVTLFDNQADDGAVDEKDNVKSDVENVLGGAGDDILTGSPGPNELKGGPGDDSINGQAGPDVLVGDAGEDNLSGMAGEDREYGGDDSDSVDGGSDADVLYGNFGKDRVTGASGADTASGGPGKDQVVGGSENDYLYGKEDDDLLVGDAGADVMQGGGGVDMVSYATAIAPVTADLDGVNYDDGPEGEGDSIGADVEQLLGGTVGDVLTGNAEANLLRGGEGNDTLDGLEGIDELYGEVGDDTLNSQDQSADTDDCGTGTDTVNSDPADTLVDCEPAPGNGGGGGQDGGGGGTGGGTIAEGPALTIGPRKVRLTRRGKARIKVSCPVSAQTACTGTLTLGRTANARTSTLGSRGFTIASGRTVTVTVTVSRRAKRLIRKRALRVEAVGSAQDAASAARVTTRAITLKRFRR